MKIRLLRVAAAMTIAVASFAPALSQTNYRQPSAVSYSRLLRRTFPQYYGPEVYKQLLPAGFYPIGWSRDGKFAYYAEPADEDCGCYFAELVIQDLRTDKELWKFKNDPQSRTNAEGEPIEDDIRRLWRRNQKLFSSKLREHGIIPNTRFALLGKSFVLGGKSYKTKVTAPKSKDDEYEMDRVKSIAIDLTSTSLGKKTVYATEYKGDEIYAAPLDVSIAGAFKSPYENRVAIVLLKVQRGWEGPPHTVDVQIFGADLLKGFSNK